MTSTAPETFAALLTSLRSKAGLTQGEVAEGAGVTAQFVSMLETNVRRPSVDTVERLIVALDLTPRAAGIFRRVAAAER